LPIGNVLSEQVGFKLSPSFLSLWFWGVLSEQVGFKPLHLENLH